MSRLPQVLAGLVVQNTYQRLFPPRERHGDILERGPALIPPDCPAPWPC